MAEGLNKRQQAVVDYFVRQLDVLEWYTCDLCFRIGCESECRRNGWKDKPYKDGSDSPS